MAFEQFGALHIPRAMRFVPLPQPNDAAQHPLLSFSEQQYLRWKTLLGKISYSSNFLSCCANSPGDMWQMKASLGPINGDGTVWRICYNGIGPCIEYAWNMTCIQLVIQHFLVFCLFTVPCSVFYFFNLYKYSQIHMHILIEKQPGLFKVS